MAKPISYPSFPFVVWHCPDGKPQGYWRQIKDLKEAARGSSIVNMVYLLDPQHGNDEHDMSDIMLQLENNVQSGKWNSYPPNDFAVLRAGGEHDLEKGYWNNAVAFLEAYI